MAAPYAWEVESDSEHDGPDGGDVHACMSAEDAAAELVELLTFLKHSGKLPAIYASQIAWFASRAGAVDATLANMGLPLAGRVARIHASSTGRSTSTSRPNTSGTRWGSRRTGSTTEPARSRS